MNPICFYLDEDVQSGVATAMKRLGIDVVTTLEAGWSRQDDEAQLAWSTAERRVLVTYNVSDFARLHTQWQATGRYHAGIVLSAQRSLGDAVRRLVRIQRELTADQLQDRLEYLSDWEPVESLGS